MNILFVFAHQDDEIAGATRMLRARRDGDHVQCAYLTDHVHEALAFLESQAGQADEVYTLAWEGGHQDHDAAHLVALAFAQRRGIPCHEMPLYNGYRSPGSLFRVMHPFGDGWTTRR